MGKMVVRRRVGREGREGKFGDGDGNGDWVFNGKGFELGFGLEWFGEFVEVKGVWCGSMVQVWERFWVVSVVFFMSGRSSGIERRMQWNCHGRG